MKKSAYICLILLCLVYARSEAQNFIGMHKDQIKHLMKETQPTFYLSTSTVNKYFNYLKYENDEGTQTYLIFLSDKDSCNYFKQIYDYIHLPDVTIQLKNSSKRKNDTLWILQDQTQLYEQIIQKGEWFFTVVTRKQNGK